MKTIAKLLSCLTILVIAVCSINAQNAAKNWVFGNGVRLDFNNGAPVASALPPGAINTWEGTASISDSSGNLLFYTNGRTVKNKNNTQMPNGFGLTGHNSSTNSAFIIPCSCGKYFIFTAGVWEDGYAQGLRYSVVDMSLDGNLGDIVAASKNIPLLTGASEKIAAVSDGNGGFWMVAHRVGDDGFYSYHIPAGGDCTISAPVISNVGTSYTDTIHGAGQMKISPDGTRLATALYSFSGTSFLELFQFNTITGAVSNLEQNPHRNSSTNGFYGVEFSPDSKALYATTIVKKNLLYRYDITLNTLTPSLIQNFGTGPFLIGALQLAPDGRIYLAHDAAANNFLSVLPAPNIAGGGWTNSVFPLAAGSNSRLGLPSMIAGDFSCGQQGCCDQVKVTPFWTPDLSLSWKAFEVFNVKYPASNICSIDIDIRSATSQPPPNPWNGGGLKVNSTTLAVPAWWRSPYIRIPNGTNGQTVIGAAPNFAAAAVNFNLGLDYSGTYTGKVKFIFRHCDGTTCEYLSDNWTPSPPQQLAMRINERYLGDMRAEFLPLSLGFSDGLNIKSSARWIAVEPLDAGTEVFSVDGDRALEGEDAAGRPKIVIASARKQENAALYELAKPIDLERFTGGEIKLVLKRSAGNSIKPRLRFLFFDENANMIGYATNDKW